MRYVKNIFIGLFGLCCLLACSTTSKKEFVWAAMDHNVCTQLKGKVLVYAFFANTKKTDKWTEEDIQETEDSIRAAFDWIKEKARANNVDLEFDIIFHDTIKFVLKDFPGYEPDKKKQSESVTDDEKVTKWANACVKRIGPVLPPHPFNDGMPHVGAPADMERWIARLRDENECNNVLFMWMLNTPKGRRFTASANIMSNKNVEFVVSSFRSPTVIAFEALRVFGAVPVYIGGDLGISSKRLSKIKKQYPNDVMVNPFVELEDAEIGEFTQFLVGWRKEKSSGIEL